MKRFKQFILESLDENTFWKIDKYFERNEEEKKVFIDMVDYFRENLGFNTKTVEEYIKDKDIKNLKKFIDFLDDVINTDNTNRDYNYLLYMVIKLIISDKVEGIKYTNKEKQK